MLVHGPENINIGNSSLFRAIKDGKIEDIIALIQAGIDIETPNNKGFTPLEYSIKCHQSKIIEILIDSKVDLGGKDPNKKTPLEFAIANNYIQEAKILIDKGALKIADADIYATINFVIENRQTDIMEYILKKEYVDLEKNIGGFTILAMAILEKDPEITEILVEQYMTNINTNCTINGVTYSPIGLATFERNIEIVEILAVNGADLEIKDSNGLTPLQVAMRSGEYVIAKILIENGAIQSNISEIELAIIDGNEQALIKLIVENKSLDFSNITVPLLHICLRANQTGHIMDILLNAGADINAVFENNTVLGYAAYSLNLNAVKKLIEAKVTISTVILQNAFNSMIDFLGPENEAETLQMSIFKIIMKNGENAQELIVTSKVWKAIIKKNNIELIQYLLGSKVNTNALYEQNQKTKLLDYALELKLYEIVELLLKELSKIDENFNGMTLLHYAISRYDYELVMHSLKNNADKEALFQEKTSLHFALHCYAHNKSELKYFQIINTLINAKANVVVVCLNNTPLQYAFGNGLFNVLKLLVKAGANFQEFQNDIHFAISANNNIVPTLLLNKNNLEKQYYGMTPLHLAIFLGNQNAISFLTSAGANTEARYANMTALHHAINKNQLFTVQLLILANANKEALFNKITPFHIAIHYKRTEIAHFICDSLDNKTVPVEIARSIEDRALLSKVIPHCTLFDIPITDLVDLNHFDSDEKRVEFVTNPQKYLFKYKLVTPKILHALSLFILHQHVMRHEASTRENIDSDSKVICANTHFKHKVQPHFAEYFSSTEAHETMLNKIFSDIRALIIDYIAKDAKESENHSLLTFIAQNKPELINASDEALKASCAHFTLANPAHAAFRGFNTYAPVKNANNWPNLLTAPLENKQIWTTEADNQTSKRGLQEAYEILKERLAYYYLAVVDPNDGDKQTRESRIENFISLLADIRNAHGLDDPSCYPGTITRIAMMGAFHQIAQLPPTTKERIEDYLKEVILDKFTKEMQSASSYEDKEALYLAITVLNIDSAKGIIKHPERYQDNWGSLRQNFLKNIGDADVHLNTIFERDLFTVIKDDVTFFRFYLCNMGIGKIGEALASAFNRYTDSVPTVTDIDNLNSFDDNKSKEYELFDLLKNVLLDVKPECKTSLRNLRLFKEALSNNVTLILKGKRISTVLESFELEDATQDKLNDTIKQILCDKKWKMPVINPFDDKIEKMNSLISKPTTTPQFSAYTTNRDSLLKKQAKFNSYLDIIEKELQNVWFDNEVVAEVIESLVQSNNTELDQDTFLSSLDEKPRNFLEQFPELIEKLGMKIDAQKLACIN